MLLHLHYCLLHAALLLCCSTSVQRDMLSCFVGLLVDRMAAIKAIPILKKGLASPRERGEDGAPSSIGSQNAELHNNHERGASAGLAASMEDGPGAALCHSSFYWARSIPQPCRSCMQETHNH